MNEPFKTAEDAPRGASAGKAKTPKRERAMRPPARAPPDRDAFPDYLERARRLGDLIAAPALPLIEIALFLDLPISTLDKLRGQGKGPKCFRLGRRLYVRQQDLRVWLDHMAATEAA